MTGQTNSNSFSNPLVFDPTTAAAQYLQVANRGGSRWFGFVTDPDHPYAATPLFHQMFDGSLSENALATTMVMIENGAYPVYETLTGAELQLPGGGGVLYDVYTVGPPDNPLAQQRLANVSGSNIFYYSPYHYQPGPGVPNVYVQFTYAPGF